jgi:hypothetical protein
LREVPGEATRQPFLAIVQTPSQREWARQFGVPVLFLDSTHGTNVYGFFLTTAVIFAPQGHGIPLGFMVCSRETEACFTMFLRMLKKCTPTSFGRTVFMTDKCQAEINSIKTVFHEACLLFNLISLLQPH